MINGADLRTLGRNSGVGRSWFLGGIAPLNHVAQDVQPDEQPNCLGFFGRIAVLDKQGAWLGETRTPGQNSQIVVLVTNKRLLLSAYWREGSSRSSLEHSATRTRSCRVVHLGAIDRLGPMVKRTFAFAHRSGIFYGFKGAPLIVGGKRMTTAIYTALVDALPPDAVVTPDEYESSFPTQALRKLMHSIRLDTSKQPPH